ncbi:MAG: hypothetical protein JWN14_4663 [Chthonomonadales bacterium]|nr:hypothetical protein [Chthonomonadales bacterium]
MPTMAHSDLNVSSTHESTAMPQFHSAIGRHTTLSVGNSTEQPQARQVGWLHYLGTVIGKSGLYFNAIATAGIGMAILTYALYNLIHDTLASHGQINTVIFLLSESIVMCGIGVAAIWYGKHTFESAKRVEAVVPMTQHNIDYLSEFETLLRASERSPYYQYSDLHSAPQTTQETPCAELLRATSMN